MFFPKNFNICEKIFSVFVWKLLHKKMLFTHLLSKNFFQKKLVNNTHHPCLPQKLFCCFGKMCFFALRLGFFYRQRGFFSGRTRQLTWVSGQPPPIGLINRLAQTRRVQPPPPSQPPWKPALLWVKSGVVNLFLLGS